MILKADKCLCVIADKICSTITSIADTWFSWAVPALPVMSIEFKRVDVLLDSGNTIGLIRRETNILLGKFKCTSHCNIAVLGMEKLYCFVGIIFNK